MSEASLSSEEQLEVWKLCEGRLERTLGECKQAFIKEDFSMAEKLLQSAQSLGAPMALIEALRSSAELISGARELNEFDHGLSLSKVGQDVILVLASGVGWSGSGAVVDWLSEYEGAEVVYGEYPSLARGNFNLAQAFHNLEDQRVLREQLIGVLFGSIIGFDRVESWRSLSTFFMARKLYSESQPAKFARGVLMFSIFSRLCIDEPDLEARKIAFERLARLTVSLFCLGSETASNKVYVLDNVASVDKVPEVLRFLKNTTALCVFRDPRSNFVALVSEYPGFASNASEYASHYIKEIFPLSQKIKGETSQNELGSRAIHVQFENFVMSSSYRSELESQLLNLGSPIASKRKFFPSESVKNVYLHQSFSPQVDIRNIRLIAGRACLRELD